jgi:hypothetical protein
MFTAGTRVLGFKSCPWMDEIDFFCSTSVESIVKDLFGECVSWCKGREYIPGEIYEIVSQMKYVKDPLRQV